MSEKRPCGPYVCPFPGAADHRRGDQFTCPNCGTVYQLTRRYKPRWWRNWYAEHGYWELAPRSRGGRRPVLARI